MRAYPCWLWAGPVRWRDRFLLASAELTDDEDDDGPDYDWCESLHQMVQVLTEL
jgi:hypothetical protein